MSTVPEEVSVAADEPAGTTSLETIEITGAGASSVDSGTVAMALKPPAVFFARPGRALARVACVSCGAGPDAASAPPSPSLIVPTALGARDRRSDPGAPGKESVRPFRPAAREAMLADPARMRCEGTDSVDDDDAEGEETATDTDGPRPGTEAAVLLSPPLEDGGEAGAVPNKLSRCAATLLALASVDCEPSAPGEAMLPLAVRPPLKGAVPVGELPAVAAACRAAMKDPDCPAVRRSVPLPPEPPCEASAAAALSALARKAAKAGLDEKMEGRFGLEGEPPAAAGAASGLETTTAPPPAAGVPVSVLKRERAARTPVSGGEAASASGEVEEPLAAPAAFEVDDEDVPEAAAAALLAAVAAALAR